MEYGKDNQPVIVLLHGGGLSWWNFREEAEKLSSDYHVILPILNGHAESDAAFTTIEDNAAEIIAFIDEKFDGAVLLMGGLSLGGQVLLEILSQRKNICRYALIESALTVPSKITHAMIRPVFASAYGLIRCRWFSMLQFRALRIKRDFFEAYFRDTCGISKSDMIAFLEANALFSVKESIADCLTKAYIFVGEKENRAMKKSAEIIHGKMRGSLVKILPQMHHGEFSLNHADAYADMLRKVIAQG